MQASPPSMPSCAGFILGGMVVHHVSASSLLLVLCSSVSCLLQLSMDLDEKTSMGDVPLPIFLAV